MSFQARLTLALIAVAIIPLAILGYGVRSEMTARLDRESTRRVDDAGREVTARINAVAADSRARLKSLGADLAAENRFRIAVAGDSSPERAWLLDWAQSTMTLAGFAVLELQDAGGRILSSGQFRNDFGRAATPLLRAVAGSPGNVALVDARTPGGTVRALVAMREITVRDETYRLLGGPAFDSERVAQLSPDRSVAAFLSTNGASRPGDAVPVVTLPYVNEAADRADSARVFLVADPGPVGEIKAGVTRWLILTLGGTLLVAIIVAALLGRVFSAPLAELAGRTGRLDLDKLDQRFATGRSDEVGALERTLDALTARLRTSVSRLREAERSAATGDLARQINHDIKNGLAPIRNVLRHLSQTAERDPAGLATIYAERRGTIESSIDYLDQLARNYARLSPALGRALTDARPVVLDVAHGVSSSSGVTVDVRVPDALPPVRADAVVLRRILENIVSNAVEALDGNPGTVTMVAEAVGDGVDRRVRFAVTDTGHGMTRQELDRAFDDFYTTKPAGTGLGLSVVRRLLTDLGGSVRAETAPGRGSTFSVEVPAGQA